MPIATTFTCYLQYKLQQPARASTTTQRPAKTDEMTISITGATGFIGRKLVQRLVADNHKIRVLTRSMSKAKRIFPGKKQMITLEL